MQYDDDHHFSQHEQYPILLHEFRKYDAAWDSKDASKNQAHHFQIPSRLALFAAIRNLIRDVHDICDHSTQRQQSFVSFKTVP